MSKVQPIHSFRGGGVFMAANQWYDEDHPVVKLYPHLFHNPSDDTPVRTTATTPSAPTAPPPTMEPDAPIRPAVTAPKATWARYVTDLGGDPDGLTKTALQALAAELEGG